MPARRVNPTLERWFAAAEDAGWDVDRKIKRATLTHPSGTQVIVSLTPGDADLRRFVNRMHTYGVQLSEPKPDQRLAKLSVQQRAAMVWDHMRTAALDRDFTYRVKQGVGYYEWVGESLCDVIQQVFPSLTEYEPEKRPSQEGQRPIYDYLRSNGLVVAFGQQRGEEQRDGGFYYHVSDVWDVNAVRAAHQRERRAVRTAPEPAEPPSVIRGRTASTNVDDHVRNMVTREPAPEPTPEPRPIADEQASAELKRRKDQLFEGLGDIAEATNVLNDRLLELFDNLPEAASDPGELAYWQTEAEQQKRRAEASEQMIRDIRHAVETLPIGQAFGRIIEIVPPSPLAR